MKIRALLLTILLAVSFGMSNDVFARNCKKGKPCGNSCISKNDVCHKESGAAPAESTAAAPAESPAQAPSEAAATKVKHCKKGKPCGNSCISEKATCNAS